MQCLFVDNTNKVVLAATMDKVIRAYDLNNKPPVIKYAGHEEVVRGIDFLPEKGLYVSGTQLRCSPVMCCLLRRLHACGYSYSG